MTVTLPETPVGNTPAAKVKMFMLSEVCNETITVSELVTYLLYCFVFASKRIYMMAVSAYVAIIVLFDQLILIFICAGSTDTSRR